MLMALAIFISRINNGGTAAPVPGKSNPQVNMQMMQLSRLGKALIVLSIAISVYDIYNADDKISAPGRQLAINSAGRTR